MVYYSTLQNKEVNEWTMGRKLVYFEREREGERGRERVCERERECVGEKKMCKVLSNDLNHCRV